MSTEVREFSLQLEKESAGSKRPGVVVCIDGESTEILYFNLEVSPQTTKKRARELAVRYSLDEKTTYDELVRVSQSNSSVRSINAQRRKQRIEQAPDIYAYIRSQIDTTLVPTRGNVSRGTIYFDRLGGSLSCEGLFQHLGHDIEFVNGIANTAQGLEDAAEGAPAKFRVCRRNLKESLGHVFAHLIRSLESDDGLKTECDRELEEYLQRFMQHVFLKDRNFKKENGNSYTDRVSDWYESLAVTADSWIRFHDLEIFAKWEEKRKPKRIAMNKALAAGELKFPHQRGFMATMKRIGLGHERAIWCDGRTRHVIEFSNQHISRDIELPPEDNDMQEQPLDDRSDANEAEASEYDKIVVEAQMT